MSSESVLANWPAEMSYSHHGECDFDAKEQARLQVLNSLLAEHVTLDQAATLLGVTTRHTRRILAAYREKGAAAVAHGHRGRRPANATSEAVTADVVHLARTSYGSIPVGARIVR